MQIITPQGQIVGEAVIRHTNNFKVRVVTPLSPGVYKFYLRAMDDAGHLSLLSRPFEIRVVPKKQHHDPIIGAATPKGPQASSKS